MSILLKPEKVKQQLQTLLKESLVTKQDTIKICGFDYLGKPYQVIDKAILVNKIKGMILSLDLLIED